MSYEVKPRVMCLAVLHTRKSFASLQQHFEGRSNHKSDIFNPMTMSYRKTFDAPIMSPCPEPCRFALGCVLLWVMYISVHNVQRRGNYFEIVFQQLRLSCMPPSIIWALVSPCLRSFCMNFPSSTPRTTNVLARASYKDELCGHIPQDRDTYTLYK